MIDVYNKQIRTCQGITVFLIYSEIQIHGVVLTFNVRISTSSKFYVAEI